MSGAAENAKGATKEAAAALTGDDSLKREGKVDKATGKGQVRRRRRVREGERNVVELDVLVRAASRGLVDLLAPAVLRRRSRCSGPPYCFAPAQTETVGTVVLQVRRRCSRRSGASARTLGTGRGRGSISASRLTDMLLLELSLDLSGRTYLSLGDGADRHATTGPRPRPSMQQVDWLKSRSTATARRPPKRPRSRSSSSPPAQLWLRQPRSPPRRSRCSRARDSRQGFDAERSFMSDKEMSTNLEVFEEQRQGREDAPAGGLKTPTGIIVAIRSGLQGGVGLRVTTSEAVPLHRLGTYLKARACPPARPSRKLLGGLGSKRGHQRRQGGGREWSADESSSVRRRRRACVRRLGPTPAIMGGEHRAFNWVSIEAGNEKRIKQSLGKLERICSRT